MNAVAWLLAVVVVFAPSWLLGFMFWRRRRWHRAFRGRIEDYSYLPPRRVA